MFTRFKRSEFARNVLTLITGTTLAQAIPILISPILTRIFTPNDFGEFAQYMAIAGLITVLTTWRYEMSIILPKKDEHALNIVILVFMISIIASILLAVSIWLFNFRIAKLLGNLEIAYWLLLIPLTAMLSGMYQSLNYWCNRKKQYKQLAASRLIQSCGSCTGQIGIGVGFTGPSGLILGSILGQTVATTFLAISAIKTSKAYLKSISFMKIREMAGRYKKFPLLQGPSTFIESISSQLPVILLGSFFGPVVVGFFALSQRVVRIPIGIVSSSIADVFRQRAGKKFANNEDLTKEFRLILKWLMIISLPPFIVLSCIAPSLFSFIFGASWRVAGEYAQILTPLFCLSFIVSPMSVMFMVAEKQEYDLIMQIALITISTTALIVGYYIFDSPKFALGLFTMVYSIKYCIELYLSYHFCKQPVS